MRRRDYHLTGALLAVALLALVLAGCGKDSSGSSSGKPTYETVTVEVPANAAFMRPQDGEELSSPGEVPLASHEGKALTVLSFDSQAFAVFLGDDESLVTGTYATGDEELRPQLGEMFLVEEGDVLVVPDGARRMLLSSMSDDEESKTMELRKIDAPRFNDNIVPVSTRFVQLVGGEYTPVETSNIEKGREFFLEATYVREPQDEERSLRVTWDEGGERWIVVTKTVADPRLFRSGPLVIGQPGDDQ